MTCKCSAVPYSQLNLTHSSFWHSSWLLAPFVNTWDTRSGVWSNEKKIKAENYVSQGKTKLHLKFKKYLVCVWCLWQSHCKEFSLTVFSCLGFFWGFFKCLLHCSYSSFGNFKEQGDFIATQCSAVYAPEQSKRNFWNPTVSSSYLHFLLILHKIKWD